jgi:hypothetical protein
MPKRTPKPTPRPMLQGRTDAPAFASRIRTPQQGPNAALTRGLDAILPGVGTVVGAAMRRPEMMKRRGERGR